MNRLAFLLILGLMLSPGCTPPKKGAGARGSARYYLDYFRTLEEIENTFSALELSPPSLANDSMKVSASYLNPGTFCANRIPVISLSSAFTATYIEQQEDGTEKEKSIVKDEVLFLSGLHMDEATPPEVMMNFLELLIDEYYNNALFRKDLEYLIIHIVPVVNVDTKRFMDQLATDILDAQVPLTKSQLTLSPLSLQQFRKNMRFKNRCKSTEELIANHGVDLNRNFDAGWAQLSSIDQATQVTTETELKYKGGAAASEPEVIAIQKFIKAHKSLKLLVDLHDKLGPEVALNATATKQAEFLSIATKKKFYSLAQNKDLSPRVKNSTKSPVYGTVERYADEQKIPYVVGIEIGVQALPNNTDYVVTNSERLSLSFLSMTKFIARQHNQR